MAEFNLKEITARAFLDYVGPAYPGFLFDVSTKDGKLKIKKNGRKIDLNSINISSFSGGKYFLTLTLKHGKTPYKLPNEPLISLGLSKTIVETATVGKERRGTVKEYINTEDYTISIKGICFDEENPNSYPSEQVSMLRTMVEINEALDIESNPFFTLFGISKIVIKDIQFDDMMGQGGMQKYTISAISDQDFYADLEEKNKAKNELINTPENVSIGK
ncbi:DUF6046 domain-containing protein [Flavobacterium sp. PL02]|jgi:hypothetical protein|uniref:DUF6046 domain-containing protein n=1 Tax=Flavobacterium sp. PL02 TaxID=3088354 RepID=UPI002B23CB44|nr:DUF6046 domain-containing protein [Flavobacterium sp. PL02]MEA9414385.1 DUF6046 domain-containing protein [Flavobacterium sp. PL02]